MNDIIIPSLSDTYSVSDNSAVDVIPDNLGIHTSSTGKCDLFNSLPSDIFKIERVAKFINIFSQEYSNLDYTNLVLNKFVISERSEDSLTIEGIYGYFRTIVSFEKNEDDMYGLVLTNPINKIYKSEFKALKEDNYHEVSKEILRFILENI